MSKKQLKHLYILIGAKVKADRKHFLGFRIQLVKTETLIRSPIHMSGYVSSCHQAVSQYIS